MMPPSDTNRAYLSLGSNIRPEHHLPTCVTELSRFGRIVRTSRVWQSAPVGDVDQADFLNAAVLLETVLTAEALCREAIPEVEKRLLRVRDPNNVNAARTIDVDLSLFNDETISVDHRRIPDPEILSRPFVAVPLAELDSGYVLPADGRTLGEIAQSLHQGGDSGTLKPRDDVELPNDGSASPDRC